jgi:DNA-directed RNA polymerase subunit alpha
MTEATTAPATERHWLAAPPADWHGWSALVDEATSSRTARESLRNHIANHLDAAKDHRLVGLGLLAAGEPGQALPHLQASDDDLSKLLVGVAHEQLGQTAPALAVYAAMIKSRTVGARARLLRLALMVHLRQLDGLGSELAALKEAGASPADVAFAEGLLAEAQGDAPGAVASWRVALQHEPDHVEARFRLAYRLDLEGEDDEAIELYRWALDQGKTVHVGTLMNLGVLYEDRDEHDAAARCFRAVLTADPENGRARRYLADAEASRRQYYDETRERKADLQNAVLRIPVTDFELSVRARNCLQRMNIHTLGDLIVRTEGELLAFKNFGETSLQEVRDILAAKNLRLGMTMPGRSSGQVLSEQLGEDFVDEEEAAPAVPRPKKVWSDDPNDVRNKAVTDLDLSVRSRAALQTLGITTVGELCETSEETLLSCKNFGQTSLVEIKNKLKDLGLGLAP